MIFVTSFDDVLYKVSGRQLIQSFLRWQTGELDQLLCGYEGSKPSEIDGKRVIGLDLNDDPHVVKWDAQYRAKCEKHKDYWCRRAWQWYRKIPPLKFATHYLYNPWMMWLDCDCEFKGRITPEFFGEYGADLTEQWEDGVLGAETPGIFHLLGGRQWTETGVIAFHMAHPYTVSFLDEFFWTYDGGEFLKLKRWDDCWVFDSLRRRSDWPNRPRFFRDLAPAGSGLRVVEVSPLSKLIVHKKGSHLRMKVR